MELGLTNRLVLLVEDESALLRGMQAWLRDNEYGFAVMIASDGNEALSLVERYHPDLVISDVRMPGMDGLELLLACRKRFPNLRFVVVSAFGTPDMEQRSLQYGAVRFLHKPVDMTLLEYTIVDVLKQESNEARAGFLHGVSITGFLQLLSVERKTLALHLLHPGGQSGVLYLEDGSLVHAELGDKAGENAAMIILAWDDAEMWIESVAGSSAHTIDRPLPGLMMEAMRIRDEGSR